jgi:hypothetical protein
MEDTNSRSREAPQFYLVVVGKWAVVVAGPWADWQ